MYSHSDQMELMETHGFNPTMLLWELLGSEEQAKGDISIG